ncbi:response regulator [Oceanobacillus bengalensis]|uniref:Response regulator n=1 Tax=Oceanobacillus bengalensis TaxID=1435466 RepID=A0A494Z6H0_9BACI|nr:response regulator [Oceanobacillus bengalensis]RKQ18162.1 response regulator [Oceanobacillus bengalensis]
MILLIDDSRFMRNWLKNIVEQHGYTTIEASSGEDGIRKYHTLKPAIVILDITLPDMDGITVLKRIIEINSNAKVIMCSAMGTRNNMITALQIGATDFIVKPHFDNLVSIIDRMKESEVISR